MKYTVEIGPGGMICIRSFIKSGSGIQALIWGGGICRQHGDLIGLLVFLKVRKVG
jgi:hypothetical protein